MNAAAHILLVIDDVPLRQAVAEHLESSGLAVALAEDAPSALALAAGRHLIVIDQGMAGARPLCCQLRGQGVEAPLLLLAAAGEEACPAHGDTVLIKPLRLPLLARTIADLLARQSESPDFQVGPWRFEGSRRLLTAPGGAKCRLTDKEAGILCRLARAGGEVVPREVLLAEVWGYSAAIDTHTLETHIYKLRRKIEAEPAAAGLLVSEAGGYRLS